MKKAFVVLFAIALAAVSANAGTVTVSLSVTNGQAITYSDPINIAGTLQKIEVVQTSGATNTITIASYSGTTAVDTFASLTSLAGNKVVRPVVLPTDNTGTDMTSTTGATASVSRVLNVPYVKPYIGGNVKLAVTSVGGPSSTVTATLYYEKPMSW